MQDFIQSEFLKLNLTDVAKGAVVAVIVAFLGALGSAFSDHSLNVLTFDWGSILHVALEAGIAYLVKNFFSTSDGKFLGKIG